MTTAKARYELQTGAFVDDIRFDEAQLAMLRSIKDDDAFVAAIQEIAEIYVCRSNSGAEELNSGELRATLEDLRRSATALGEKLERIPQTVEMALPKFTFDSYRSDSIPKKEVLKTLLDGFVDEIEDALDGNATTGKAGRPREDAKWYAADSLKSYFESRDLPVTISQGVNATISPITECLDLIFVCSGHILSRSRIEDYLKPIPKGKLPAKKGE